MMTLLFFSNSRISLLVVVNFHLLGYVLLWIWLYFGNWKVVGVSVSRMQFVLQISVMKIESTQSVTEKLLLTDSAMKVLTLKQQKCSMPFTGMMILKISWFSIQNARTPLSRNSQKYQNTENLDCWLLALVLLCISPDTIECICGYSNMNLTENVFSTRLAQSNLQARSTVCMDKRNLSTFPRISLKFFLGFMY